MVKININESQLEYLKEDNELEYNIHDYSNQIATYLNKVSNAAGCERGGYDYESNLYFIESNCGDAVYIFDMTYETGQLFLKEVSGKFYTEFSEPNKIIEEFNRLTTILIKHPFKI